MGDSTENMRTLAETFRSLRLFSPSLSLQPHFKSILLKEKIVSQSFNSPQRGIASHSPITCRAAVVYGQGEPLRVEEVEVSPPGPGQVRLRLASASICHTDLWVWRGEDRGMMAPFPMILGHEGAGEVEAVGEGVDNLKVHVPGIMIKSWHAPSCLQLLFKG